jgi:proline iminopeptidase
MHHHFIKEQQILNNIDKLQTIPSIIVHGQQDLLCPLEGAYLLHQAWKNARLDIVPTGGHLGSVPEMAKAVVQAAKDMTKFIM